MPDRRGERENLYEWGATMRVFGREEVVLPTMAAYSIIITGAVDAHHE